MIRHFSLTAAVLGTLMASQLIAADVLKPISERYAGDVSKETPDFQRHMVPLMSMLGCNGRACHGSFQGQGDFRLSLFGYDFKSDHEELAKFIDTDAPADSYALQKGTLSEPHRGGKRMEVGSWQYKVFTRWVEEGAKAVAEDAAQLVRVDVTPSEIVFDSAGQQVQLKAVAVWSDGVQEDVTPLCRFQSNDDQVAEINKTGLVTATKPGDSHLVAFYSNAVIPVPVMQPVSDRVGMSYPAVDTPTQVDELVVEKLRKMGVVPSDVCSDADFLRRVSLDLTGTLPKPADVEAFVKSSDANKRSAKVNELLNTDAYAAWWTTKLSDFTGANTEQLNNVSPMRNAVAQEWFDWIQKRVRENTSYDQLVAGIVTAKSRDKDESYLEFCEKMSSIYRDDDKKFEDLKSMPYYWARRDFRELEARAIGFAYSFLGIRIQCAQCHKHPFDQWTTEDFHKFKNFFSRVSYANNGSDRTAYNKLVADLGLKGLRGNDLRRKLPDLIKDGKTIPFPELMVTNRAQRSRNADGDYPVYETAKLLGGEEYDSNRAGDPRELVMEWLRSKDNPLFARAFVNRVWASYFNRGIVHPADDNSLANPPSNKALLDYLAKGFIESGFDMKWVHRTIANSATYQRSWVANETNETDERNFSRAVARRLPAEVAYDAIKFATASDAQLATYHGSTKGRSIALATAGARYARTQYALSVFGRSTRDSNCDCDRSEEPSLLQTVFLQNDSEVQTLLSPSRNTWIGQVAAEINPKKARNNRAANSKQAQALRQQMAQLYKKFQRAKEAKDETAMKATQAKLKAGRKRLEAIAPTRTDDADKVEIAATKVGDLVTQTYLRTLSRYPTDEELARSTQYVKGADDTVDGVRDLLWALLNTKEFIVNH